MKSIIKKILVVICSMLGFINLQAQAIADSLMYKHNSAEIEPFRITVAFNKTTHLIFPSAIRYVDLGSEYLTAGKADDAANVLRIKAAVKDFEEESNFSVITDDGKFYSFSVFYSPYPSILTYNLESMDTRLDSRANIHLEDLGFSPSIPDQLMEAIYKRNRNNIKHIASRSFGIQFSLKGIYIHEGKYYFNTQIQNKANVSFQIDFVSFKIMDKKVAKRTVFQEKPLNIVRTYSDLSVVPENKICREIYLLDQFTLDHDKILVIEVFEKNGGRHQRLEIENDDLIRAVLLKDLSMKIK